MIEKENFKILNFVKKDDYTGSMKGMRYLIRSISKEEMKVYIWPEPFAFAKTESDLITEKTFSLSEEGVEEARCYLNEQYESRKQLWDLSLTKKII